MKREDNVLKLYKWCGIIAFAIVLFAAVLASMRTQKTIYLCERTHVVSAGETLWGICAQYKPEGMDMGEYVTICRKASCVSDVIYPGDIITVFTEVSK